MLAAETESDKTKMANQTNKTLHLHIVFFCLISIFLGARAPRGIPRPFLILGEGGGLGVGACLIRARLVLVQGGSASVRACVRAVNNTP